MSNTMPKGLIPPSLKLDHAGRLQYSEQRAIEALLVYVGEVNKERVDASDAFHSESMGHALARLMFLIDPAGAERAIALYRAGRRELGFPIPGDNVQ